MLSSTASEQGYDMTATPRRVHSGSSKQFPLGVSQLQQRFSFQLLLPSASDSCVFQPSGHCHERVRGRVPIPQFRFNRIWKSCDRVGNSHSHTNTRTHAHAFVHTEEKRHTPNRARHSKTGQTALALSSRPRRRQLRLNGVVVLWCYKKTGIGTASDMSNGPRLTETFSRSALRYYRVWLREWPKGSNAWSSCELATALARGDHPRAREEKLNDDKQRRSGVCCARVVLETFASRPTTVARCV